MAKKNKLGTSFLGLGLEKHEETKMKEILAAKDVSANQFLRKLIRDYIAANPNEGASIKITTRKK